MNRQEVKKHQGKVGVVCGLGVAGVYQGYVSHVLECPGEISLQQVVTSFDLSDGEKKVRCSQSGSSQEDQQVLTSLLWLTHIDCDLRVTFKIWFSATDSTNPPRVNFDDLLEELGPSILPASHSHYQRYIWYPAMKTKVDHFLQGCLRVEQAADGKPGCSTDLWQAVDGDCGRSGTWYIGSFARFYQHQQELFTLRFTTQKVFAFFTQPTPQCNTGAIGCCNDINAT